MKILIIGGTGFIGPYVVKKLIELGHEIALFNRGNKVLNHDNVFAPTLLFPVCGRLLYT